MSVIMVGGLDTHLIAVAAGLVRRGVPITCFLDRYHEPAKDDPTFDGVLKIDASRFRYPEAILKLNEETNETLPAALIEQFLKCESVFLSLGDRYGFNVSVIERKVLYHELLLYFYRFLTTNVFRLIIFPNVPHDVWNNILYCVAKNLGIKTLIIEETLINDRVILWEDYEQVPAVPDDYLAGKSRDEILPLVDSHIRDELFNRSAGLQEAVENNQRALQIPGVGVLTWLFVQQFAEALRVKTWRIVTRTAPTRIEDKVVLILNKPGSEVLATIRRYVTRLAYRRLYSYYEQRCLDPRPEDSYVLFFLNYQPEKKTTPMGGVFADQCMAVKMLAQSIPKDWFIYLREHPLQFKGSIGSQYYRSRTFYDRLLRLPNVRLISTRYDQKKLIDGAICTATVAGSVGWQGLLAGKASLTFGQPWYTGCRSCYHVTSREECQAALHEIQRKNAAAVELDVLRWLVFTQPRLIIGTTSYRVGSRSQRSLEMLADSLAEGLAPQIHQALEPRVFSPAQAAAVL